MKKRRINSRTAETWHRLKKNKFAIAGLVVIILFILVAAFAPLLAPYAYDTQDLAASYAKPSAEHLLGTDKFGRDTLSRLIWGSRKSLEMGIGCVALSSACGIFLGSIAGYFGGLVDNIIMRVMDTLSCVPMLLMCVVIAAILGPSVRNAIIAIAISATPSAARLIRANILKVRDNEYIEAAKSIDCSSAHIILQHIIPNAISPSIVAITMNIGNSIISGATLSFIGLGAQPPLAEWGCMLSEGRNFMRDHMELVLYPGICIMITVLAFNLLGDGLRDALDPRLKN
jgi:peptide/nickel transport system permease protein